MNRTLHVATVHFRSDTWIEPQVRAVRAHAPAGTRLWAVLDGIEPSAGAAFDEAFEFEGTHPQRLNELARRIGAVAAPDDAVLFLDGDAVPVASLQPVLAALDATPLVAVRRDENLGDPQPHPCFAVTTLRCWTDLEGDWRGGHRWTNSNGELVTDVGGNLLAALETSRTPWRALTRCNGHDLHPLWFALYGDAELGPVVYHHGAGFRDRVARVDGAPPATSTAGALGRVPLLGPVVTRARTRRAEQQRAQWLATTGEERRREADEVLAYVLSGGDLVARFGPGAGDLSGG